MKKYILAALAAALWCIPAFADWEVQPGELAVILLCGFIVGACGLLWRVVIAERHFNPIILDLRSPSSVPARYPLKATGIVSSLPSISLILCARRLPQIYAAIVERVSVYMVRAFSRSRKNGMHKNGFSAQVPLRVELPAGRMFPGAPVRSRQRLKISGVHDSNVAICERNEANRWISWLNNFRSRLNVSRHVAHFTVFAGLALLILGTGNLYAQNPTAVTGTILDPSSVPYYPAQVIACLTPNTLDPTVGGKHVNNNIGTNYCVGSVPTATDGSFALSLFANGNIAPAATQWVFTVQTVGAAPPAGKGSQSFTTAAVTISGSSQSVTASFTGLPALLNSSSSSSSSAAPNMGFYFTPQCLPGQLNCVPTFADTVENNTCSWTNASTTVTCLTEAMSFAASVAANVATYTGTFPSNWVAGNSVTITAFSGGDAFFQQTCTLSTATTTALTCPLVHANASSTTSGTIINNNVGPFTSADVGKVVKGGQTCASDQNVIGGQISTTVDVTILALISSTQVTLSATPSQTATLVIGYPQGACLVYGHLDDAAATTLEGLLQLSPNCPKLFMAAANYFFSKPHFFNNPLACNNIGPGIGMPFNFGNTVLSAGFEIEGRGTGTTAWFLTASFPNGDLCNHKPTSQEIGTSSTGGGCFAIPTLGKWVDFRVDGGPQSGRGSLPNALTSLIIADFSTLMNFTCINMAYTDGQQTGIEMGGVVAMYQVNIAGCGGIAIRQNTTNGGTSQLIRVTAENASAASLMMTGPVLCNGCFFLGGIPMTFTGVIQNFGSTLRMENSIVSPSPGGLFAGDAVNGYRCMAPGCVLYADDTAFSFFSSGGASNLNSSIQCLTTNSCTNYLRNVTLTSQSAGGTYNDGTSGNSVLYDEGGNTLVTTRFVTTGSIIADGRSFTGACTGVATASSTLALRITGTSTTGTGIPTTCTSTTLDAGIVMTQNRTLSDLHCSSSATTVSVACTVMVNGVASAITCTMTAATSCIDELAGHTVAVLKGDLVSERIVTGAAETGANIKAFVMWQ